MARPRGQGLLVGPGSSVTSGLQQAREDGATSAALWSKPRKLQDSNPVPGGLLVLRMLLLVLAGLALLAVKVTGREDRGVASRGLQQALEHGATNQKLWSNRIRILYLVACWC